MLFRGECKSGTVSLSYYFGVVIFLAVFLFGLSAWMPITGEVISPLMADVRTSINTPAPTSSSQNLTNVGYKPNLRVWLHPEGVRPAIIRAAPGRVVLRVKNETAGDGVLVVEQLLSAQRLVPIARIATRGLDRRSFRNEVVLTPGEYVYYSESRPQFKGRLIVALPE